MTLSAAEPETRGLKLLSYLKPQPPGVEIISFTPDGARVACSFRNSDHFGVLIFKLDAKGQLELEHRIDLAADLGWSAEGITSVALDPMGRGFGVAAVLPSDAATRKGLLRFFNYRNGEVLGTGLETGFHPDCVSFSEDGRYVLVANEGEQNPVASTEGSLGVVDLKDIPAAGPEVPGLSELGMETFDLQNLGELSLQGVRNHEPGVPLWQSLEPEYVVAVGDKAYLSLQENNALAVFNLPERRWEAIHPLGTLVQTIDTNDKDNAADISQKVAGLPMPDTIAAFTHGDEVYVATANEGDTRSDKADAVRVKDADLEDSLAPLKDNSRIGRLEISKLDGDTDGNGKIDVPTMFGTRSFSLWDPETGKLVFDSGSLETHLYSLDPKLHNTEQATPAKMDSRSDKKGPEPEALALGKIGDIAYLFLGLERQNGLLMYELSQPANPVFRAYVNTVEEGLVAPESLVFIPASESPTGVSLLLGGYEAQGGGIGVFQVLP